MNCKKRLSIFFLVCAVFLSLWACAQRPYDEEWIIGKTSAEIEEKYGQFQRISNPYHEDGLLYRTDAGYIIKKSRVSWHGKTTEVLFVVRFNQDGLASYCGIEPGNWGG